VIALQDMVEFHISVLGDYSDPEILGDETFERLTAEGGEDHTRRVVDQIVEDREEAQNALNRAVKKMGL
jgi:hypothetical protein